MSPAPRRLPPRRRAREPQGRVPRGRPPRLRVRLQRRDRRARADHRSRGTGRRPCEDPDGALAAVHASYAFTLPVPGATIAVLGPHLGGRPARPAAPRPAHRDDRLPLRPARSRATSPSRPCSPPSTPSTGGSGTARRPTTSASTVAARCRAARRARARRAARCGSSHRRRRRARRPRRRRAPRGRRGPARAGSPATPTRCGPRMLVDPPAWREGAEPLRIVDGARRRGRRPRATRCSGARRTGRTAARRAPSRCARRVALDAAATHRALVVPAGPRPHGHRRGRRCCPSTTRCCTCWWTRAPAVPEVNDNLWVRLLDVPAALAGRRYAAPVDVVLDVHDARLPANAGRWRLTTGDRQDDGAYPAQVTRTDDAGRRAARRARARCRLPRRPVAGWRRPARGWSPSATPGALQSRGGRVRLAASRRCAPGCSDVAAQRLSARPRRPRAGRCGAGGAGRR